MSVLLAVIPACQHDLIFVQGMANLTGSVAGHHKPSASLSLPALCKAVEWVALVFGTLGHR
jgi:hypothetical protein